MASTAAAASALGDLRPVYRKLLQLAKTLPEGKRETTLQQIRTEFRSRKEISDPKECVHCAQQHALCSVGSHACANKHALSLCMLSCVYDFTRLYMCRLNALLARAQSSIGYLKIVTPRKSSGMSCSTYLAVCVTSRRLSL